MCHKNIMVIWHFTWPCGSWLNCHMTSTGVMHDILDETFSCFCGSYKFCLEDSLSELYSMNNLKGQSDMFANRNK